jgi:flagellar biosynthetic protein FliR
MVLEGAFLDLGWVLDHAALCGLVLARVLGLCLTAPALAIPELDWRFRVGISVALGAVLIPVVEPNIAPTAGAQNPALGVIMEVLTGGVLGWSAAQIVAGARLGGEIVAAQCGLSTSTQLDPETGVEQTPLGRLYAWVALAVFLALDGPLSLVEALVQSYRSVPAGSFVLSRATTETAFAQVGQALELALRIAAPPALALTVAGIVLGWLGRAAQSFPFVVLALPIRIALGVALVVLSLATVVVVLSGVWAALPQGG